MPPTVILIRHAQALHNHSIPDPELSQLGREQCKQLRESLSQQFGDVNDAVAVVSPMRRTIETALLSLGWLAERGIPIQADALWQENSAKPCDTGSSAAALAHEFPTVDFSALDPVYPDKTSPAGARYAYTRQAIEARAQSCLTNLYRRPERFVFVVSHSGFLRLGMTGHWWFNADYRIFDLVDGVSEGDLSGLRQWESTLSGGLGWSRTEKVELGFELPEEDARPPPEA